MTKVFIVFKCGVEDCVLVAVRSTLDRASSKVQIYHTLRSSEWLTIIEAPVDGGEDYDRGFIISEGDKRNGYIRHTLLPKPTKKSKRP